MRDRETCQDAVGKIQVTKKNEEGLNKCHEELSSGNSNRVLWPIRGEWGRIVDGCQASGLGGRVAHGTIRQNKEIQFLPSACGSFWPLDDPVSQSFSQSLGNSALSGWCRSTLSGQFGWTPSFFQRWEPRGSSNWERRKPGHDPPDCHQGILAEAVCNPMAKGRRYYGDVCPHREDANASRG